MQCEMARQFFDMLTVITAKQKIPKEYADGQVLYNAEIELLEKIYQYPEANISILSVKLGVTKSAVTQMSIKLLDKELIEKFQDSKNKKEKQAESKENILEEQVSKEPKVIGIKKK